MPSLVDVLLIAVTRHVREINAFVDFCEYFLVDRHDHDRTTQLILTVDGSNVTNDTKRGFTD